MEAPDFWDDAEKASADMKELKDLKSIVERADALSMAYDDIMTLIEMGNEEADVYKRQIRLVCRKASRFSTRC